MKLLEAIRNSSAKLIAEFEDSKLFEHKGEIGEYREQIISQLIRPFLPDCYGLGSGQIFSSNDEISNQIDIVIYDNIFSNILFKNKNSSLFPCESVYGEIEVKSYLSTNELIKALDNIGSMQKLKRDSSTVLNITPIYEFKIDNTLQVGRDKKNYYFGGIFAYDGIQAEILEEYLKVEYNQREKAYFPSFICCFKKQYIAFKVIKHIDNQNKVSVTPFDNNFSGYIVYDTGEDTLPLMFVYINTCLNMFRLKSLDYSKMWSDIFSKIIKENIEKGKNFNIIN